MKYRFSFKVDGKRDDISENEINIIENWNWKTKDKVDYWVKVIIGQHNLFNKISHINFSSREKHISCTEILCLTGITTDQVNYTVDVQWSGESTQS